VGAASENLFLRSSAKLSAVSAPFVIDAATGRLRFPDLDLELNPGMPEAEFIAATSRINRDNLGFNDGWQRYSVREVISGDRKLGLFFIFRNERLSKFSFAWCPKDETWDNWSEASESARQKEYQQELDSQLGGKAEFPWGRVSAYQDSKSGGTDIWIDYSQAKG
jgi:hypothetical protein